MAGDERGNAPRRASVKFSYADFQPIYSACARALRKISEENGFPIPPSPKIAKRGDGVVGVEACPYAAVPGHALPDPPRGRASITALTPSALLGIPAAGPLPLRVGRRHTGRLGDGDSVLMVLIRDPRSTFSNQGKSLTVYGHHMSMATKAAEPEAKGDEKAVEKSDKIVNASPVDVKPEGDASEVGESDNAEDSEVCDSCSQTRKSEMKELDAKYTAIRMLVSETPSDCICWFQQSTDKEWTAYFMSELAYMAVDTLSKAYKKPMADTLATLTGKWLLGDAIKELNRPSGSLSE